MVQFCATAALGKKKRFARNLILEPWTIDDARAAVLPADKGDGGNDVPQGQCSVLADLAGRQFTAASANISATKTRVSP